MLCCYLKDSFACVNEFYDVEHFYHSPAILFLCCPVQVARLIYPRTILNTAFLYILILTYEFVLTVRMTDLLIIIWSMWPIICVWGEKEEKDKNKGEEKVKDVK